MMLRLPPLFGFPWERSDAVRQDSTLVFSHRGREPHSPSLSMDLPPAINAPAGTSATYPVRIRETAGEEADIRLVVQNSVVWKGRIHDNGIVHASVTMEMPYNNLQLPIDLQTKDEDEDEWATIASAILGFNPCFPNLAIGSLNLPDGVLPDADLKVIANVINQGCEGAVRLFINLGDIEGHRSETRIPSGGTLERSISLRVPWAEAVRFAMVGEYLGVDRQWLQGVSAHQDIPVLYPEMQITNLTVPAAASPGNPIEAMAEARNFGASGSASMRISNIGETRSPPELVAQGQVLRVQYLGEMPADEQTTLEATASWLGVRRTEQFSPTVSRVINAKDAVFEYDDRITVYGGDEPLTVRGTVTGQSVRLEGPTTGPPLSPVGGPFIVNLPPSGNFTIYFQTLAVLFIETSRNIGTVKNRRLVSRDTRNYVAGVLTGGPNMALSLIAQLTARVASLRSIK